jgi:hypothetical protein
MKELIRESAKLIIGTVLVLLAFFVFFGIVALFINGLTFLPPYIGEFGTFMLYVAFFMLVFALIKYFADRNER